MRVAVGGVAMVAMAEFLMLRSEFETPHPLSMFQAAEKRVEIAYAAICGRASDMTRMNYWVPFVTSEAAWDAVVDSFLNSQRVG